MHQFLTFIFKWNSTCFGQFCSPSSGVFHWNTQQWFHPDPARKLSANLYDIYHCCVYSEKLLTILEELSKTCRVSFQNKFEKLVHLVSYKKLITMHRHMNVKSRSKLEDLSIQWIHNLSTSCWTDNGHAGSWHHSTVAKESSKQHMQIVSGSGIIRLFMPTSTDKPNYTFWIQNIAISIVIIVIIPLTSKGRHQTLPYQRQTTNVGHTEDSQFQITTI